MDKIESVTSRLRTEFLEMPGMHLSPEQVHRLCGVERDVCQAVLDALVDARFLRVSAGGQYARVTDGEVSRHRAARVVVGIDMSGRAFSQPGRRTP